MAKLPAIKSKDLCSLIETLGYVLIRQRGSHRFFKHPQKIRFTTIPMHSGDVGKGLLRKILKDIDVSPDTFLKLYSKM